jgi:hypothetical protein
MILESIMDLTRVRQLAGTTRTPEQGEMTLYRQLVEVVELPADISLDEISKRLDACKRALSIATTMQNPADKKKWVSATFVNLNKVRGAMQRMLKQMEDVPAPPVAAALAEPSAQPPAPSGNRTMGMSPMA